MVKLFVFCVHFSLCIVFVFWLIRSYKNGFVWHDLCEDDIILPAHGSEYVGFHPLLEGRAGFGICGFLGLHNVGRVP